MIERPIDPYADYDELQRVAHERARLDRLRAERDQEKAREAAARLLVEKREQAFLDRVRRRRGPLTITLARERLREPVELRAEVEHVRGLARGLAVRLATVAAVDDGSASVHWPVVATPPLVSRFAIGTALHELGHKANPCTPDHRRVTASDGVGSVCLRCELAAWRWARANIYAGLWWREQHSNLCRALRSYRHYATSAERNQMDQLCDAGPTPFATQRLRLLQKVK